MRNALRIEAPCKINLHLRVKGRRSDGFHELESVFLALAAGDTLHFEVAPTRGTGDTFLVEDKRAEAAGGAETLPRGNNIVLKAVDLFRSRTGFTPPLGIRLEKRIPLGAGLGGGSSNGAATLRALNTLAGKPLDEAGLRQAAAELGSDVPFFLGNAGTALVSGRGEHIQAIEGPPDCAVLLVKPGFPSNTAEAFRLLDAHREGNPIEGYSIEGNGAEQSELAQALKGPPSRWPFRNDFLEVFLERGQRMVRDTYRTILGRLKEAGADFCGLTGSGSACFGIFTGEGGGRSPASPAEKAAKALKTPEVFTLLTFPLARLDNTVLE